MCWCWWWWWWWWWWGWFKDEAQQPPLNVSLQHPASHFPFQPGFILLLRAARLHSKHRHSHLRNMIAYFSPITWPPLVAQTEEEREVRCLPVLEFKYRDYIFILFYFFRYEAAEFCFRGFIQQQVFYFRPWISGSRLRWTPLRGVRDFGGEENILSSCFIISFFFFLRGGQWHFFLSAGRWQKQTDVLQQRCWVQSLFLMTWQKINDLNLSWEPEVKQTDDC